MGYRVPLPCRCRRAYCFTPYRLNRITGYFNKSADTQGMNYQANQALIAIGSGMVSGMGYGKSISKVNYLPAVVDDSIFAIVGQEFGFIGSGLLVVLFGLLSFRLFWLAKRVRDNFGQIDFGAFRNDYRVPVIREYGLNFGAFAFTPGVPLPFISYGGTALAIFVTMAESRSIFPSIPAVSRDAVSFIPPRD